MPSTVVHVALAGLLVAALLPDEYFDARAVAVVSVMAILPDLDVFAGFLIEGAHRSLGHTLLFPGVVGGLLAADARREGSLVRSRFGDRGVWVAAVGLVGMVFAAIGLDYVTNGVNLFWPLHDQFFTANGRAILSNQRGFVQTFVDLSPPEPSGGSNGGGETTRTTENTHYRTGVDPRKGDEPKNVERVFPLVTSGWQLLVVATSTLVVSARLWRGR